MPRKKTLRPPPDPFRWFDSSPEVIRLVVMMYVKYPLSLRNVEDLLHERGIDICHETVRLWWTRFGPMFASEIRKKRVEAMRAHTHWKWHLDEIYVKINGEMHYFWRAVDHEGEVLEGLVRLSCDCRREGAVMAGQPFPTLLRRWLAPTPGELGPAGGEGRVG